MLRFVGDENFRKSIVRALQRAVPELDIVTVVDEGLSGIADPDLLAWAADQGRVVLTHDRAITEYVDQRVARDLSMPGIVVVRTGRRIGKAVDDLLILLSCNADDEWRDRTFYIPL